MRFQKLTPHLPPLTINLIIQHSISNTVTSTISTTMAAVQANHEKDILSFREMIEKFLFLELSTTPFYQFGRLQ